ncbi:hypothetical protein JAAARDRAFT_39602 [Jaapia argillacea MUCL 33604]|uniref:Uncharacterized protein n=1 Tax=Jaapia argillacea MUCL 33604 TaxID=933084 RepID=A0A067PPK6_9AGAM|nr:hypothetical protein JAAARDRAFT_39602 [Jaapia argillacea MUCL 33604]
MSDAVHRALRVYDVVHEIISSGLAYSETSRWPPTHLTADSRQFLHPVALSGKPLTGPALDALWSHVCDVKVLLALLPSEVVIPGPRSSMPLPTEPGVASSSMHVASARSIYTTKIVSVISSTPASPRLQLCYRISKWFGAIISIIPSLGFGSHHPSPPWFSRSHHAKSWLTRSNSKKPSLPWTGFQCYQLLEDRGLEYRALANSIFGHDIS